MKNNISLEDIIIRTTLKPGDIGYITYMHGAIYEREHGFGVSFEAYVAYGLYEFYKNYDPQKDRVWIAEHNNRIVGFLLLMHRENDSAQLRFFILENDYRGIGLGKKMIGLYIDFLKERNYKTSYLWTTNEQIAAAIIYKKLGFTLMEELESTSFGKPLKEQRYDLILNPVS